MLRISTKIGKTDVVLLYTRTYLVLANTVRPGLTKTLMGFCPGQLKDRVFCLDLQT